MLRRYSIWLFVICVVLAPVSVFAILTWYEKNFERLPVLGDKGHVTGEFKMTNQDGKPVTDKDWNGKIVVANFFFTHCPVICPKMTKNLKTVQQEFIDDDRVQINSFSIDPERDSVARLSIYASQFGIADKYWNLLTGDKKEIYRLARKSFLVVATDGDGGPNDFIHSDKLVLVDMKKRIRGFYDGTSEADVKQLIKDIKKLKKDSR